MSGEPDVAELMRQMHDVLDGTGDHADHERKQAGRCVFCSCGARVNGRMSVAQAVPVRSNRRQVRLADGFVAYRGTRADAEQIAAQHPGAVVEEATGG